MAVEKLATSQIRQKRAQLVVLFRDSGWQLVFAAFDSSSLPLPNCTTMIYLGFLYLLAAIVVPCAIGQITIEEVATHGTNDDCWTAVDGTVYDLTAYGRSSSLIAHLTGVCSHCCRYD